MFARNAAQGVDCRRAPRSAETLCDRALILVRGRIVRDLNVGDWSGQGGESLESLFLAAQADASQPLLHRADGRRLSYTQVMRRRVAYLLSIALLLGCGDDKPSLPGPTSAPVIRSVSPDSWSILSGVVPLSIDAADGDEYALWVDDLPVVSGPASPLAWNTTSVLNGPHAARLVVSNARGAVDTTIILCMR
ncbi:MAG: hypothetical protein SGI90_05890 [Candidatus Eisenbacteria bacterium]|nr:hypothetical protein [Candidatus Eisenbacteria bacterium]